jgi:hypothetical protein
MKPDWVNFPPKLVNLINNGQTDLTPWCLLDTELSIKISESLKNRYNRHLFPFAKRKNNDDVACLEKNCDQKIKIINGYTTKGWETQEEFQNFDDWLKDVEGEMKDW